MGLRTRPVVSYRPPQSWDPLLLIPTVGWDYLEDEPLEALDVSVFSLNV